jgi:hypothetical protein
MTDERSKNFKIDHRERSTWKMRTVSIARSMLDKKTDIIKLIKIKFIKYYVIFSVL